MLSFSWGVFHMKEMTVWLVGLAGAIVAFYVLEMVLSMKVGYQHLFDNISFSAQWKM